MLKYRNSKEVTQRRHQGVHLKNRKGATVFRLGSKVSVNVPRDYGNPILGTRDDIVSFVKY